MDKKKLLIIGGISIGVIVLVVVGVLLLKKPKKEEEKPKEEEKVLEVQKYELQTHEYFENLPEEDKYYISSVEELNKFYFLYSDVLNIKDKDLKDYSLFIQVKEASSGSDSYKLMSVNISGSLTFKIKEDTPEIGTDDMAFWYFVALVPNNMLEDVNISDWSLPSVVLEKKLALKDYEFKMDSKDTKFVLTTDYKYKTMKNDGGSNENIFYQIDLENKVVSKISIKHNANLGGKAEDVTRIVFAKRMEDRLVKELKTLIINLGNSNDEKNDAKYGCYMLETLNFKKEYYDSSNIAQAEKIIEKIEG